MKIGALFFVAAFVALAASWFGLVLAPQLQVGRQQIVATASGDLYPSRRPGLAEQGAQVYRANGCVSCHSQQIRQTGTAFDLVLNDAGTNHSAVLDVLAKFGSSLDAAALAALPKDALRDVDRSLAGDAEAALKKAGAKSGVRIRPVGPDLDRGWGRRGTVAQDYLQDVPVLLGSQRLGPDLANIGIRQPDPNWHLNHLYNPASVVAGSTMPPYRFLFEKRKIGRAPSPDALKFSTTNAPPQGFEIVPTDDARAVVAYLLSLKADVPLFEAPMSAK